MNKMKFWYLNILKQNMEMLWTLFRLKRIEIILNKIGSINNKIKF
jgi:hypothetical protein